MSDRKIALVTGGSRGLGRAISVRLAKDHGYHILVNYSSNAAAADETVKLINEVGGTGEPIGFNVADREGLGKVLSAWMYLAVACQTACHSNQLVLSSSCGCSLLARRPLGDSET